MCNQDKTILVQDKVRQEALKLIKASFPPGGASGKEPVCHCRRGGFDPWLGKIPWRRAWQPIPVFLPGKSHGQKSLAGYSPWGRKESDTTERLHFPFTLLNRDYPGVTGQ